MNRSSELPEVKHLVLSGAFSTGKSTVLDGLKEEFGDRFYYIADGGRTVAAAHQRNLSELPPEEWPLHQSQVNQYYQREEELGRVLVQQGEYDGIISDASLIEATAYSMDWLQRDALELLKANIEKFRRHYTSLHFPTGVIPIIDDGLRQAARSEVEISAVYAVQRRIDERTRMLHHEYDIRSVEMQEQKIEHRLAFAKQYVDHVFQRMTARVGVK